MRALVTGGTGFLGSYLALRLREGGAHVTVTGHRKPGEAVAPVPQGLEFSSMDVRDPVAVERVVEAVHPDVVYHFAGQPYVLPSWEDPRGTFATNLLGTLNLLEAIRRHRPATRFAFAGSGTEYGYPDRVPTPEDSALRPTSPYASSKAAADLLCYQYFASFEIPTFRFRIFGTTGPGKRGDSVNDFAGQISALERRGSPGTLRVGDLTKSRDVTDVRDAVRAMTAIGERGEPGDAYNIGSGVPRIVRETLDTLRSFSKVPVEVQVDPSLIRRVDEPVLLADISKLRALGWTPDIPFEQTLRDILERWRNEA
jgi:GDP-4-dehydro-6-deoxy-D-mannose reductase